MKSKYRNCLWAAVLALALVIAVGCVVSPVFAPTPTSMPEEMSLGAGRVRPLTPHLCHMYTEVDTDKWYVLVDLDRSHPDHWPHYHTNSVILKDLHYSGDLSSAKHWHWRVGVVTDIDATSADIEWISSGVRNRLAQFDEKWTLPEHGLDLLVHDDKLLFVVTNDLTTTVEITSGMYLSSCACISGTLPGVGDLILHLDEISDTATIHFAVNVAYDVE